LRSPGQQKVGEKKNRQWSVCMGGKNMSKNHQNSLIRAVEDKKNDENDNVVVAVAATVKKVWWQNF
jgi:hypothetical protein